MNIERGSSWNKWDFHIHTPYSILNNEFGFDPYDKESELLFDNYVFELFSRAIEKEIVAIGITDYFSIEGYKRIRQDYIENEEKLKQLFHDDDIRKRIKSIFVFPNIELRLNTFVGKGADSVNYHVLFSDKVSVQDIEECFLNQIRIPHNNDTILPLSRNSIELIGKEYKKYNEAKGSDYLVGLKKIAVSDKDIQGVLTNCQAFQDNYYIAIPVDEDLSSVSWYGRAYQSKRNLYQQSAFLMSSNEKTRNWALAKGREKEQIEEFKSIKPCIWGSDAHNYEKMFCPDDNRYCWIKAKPSFEGLKQILYEPEDRVAIQRYCPEEKDQHQLIDYIQFHNDEFQEEPIYFSEGLTAIIGGKSTGKSTLLRHIANGIDSKQVSEREKKVNRGKNLLNVDADVVWRDGVSGERKIIYIPQSWLNRVVDIRGGESELNTIIKDILLQDEVVNKKYKEIRGKQTVIKEIAKQNIEEYINSKKIVKECEIQLLENGRSEAFLASIKKLEEQRGELSIDAGFSEDTFTQYTELESKITNEQDRLVELSREQEYLESIEKPIAFIKDSTFRDSNGEYHYEFEGAIVTQDDLQTAITSINDSIIDNWNKALSEAKQKVSALISNASNSLTEYRKLIEPLQNQIEISEELARIEIQLSNERENYKRALDIEHRKEERLRKATAIKQKVLGSKRELNDAYIEFQSLISQLNTSDTELVFEASIECKKRALLDSISAIIDNRGFKPFKDKYHYNLLDYEELIVDESLFSSIWTALEDEGHYGSLSLKGGNDLQSTLEMLFNDWSYIHFQVKSGNDTLEVMSPGKKALVLLELLVNLENGACPILIDQPEDDLDNRSIYTDLVQYIKQKKRERQIIVVTHNANVVVGGDAEEVIIANQDAREAQNRFKRFEYRCGAIEDNNPLYDERGRILQGILNQKGIQDQICDILEGGKDAFELRKNKYFVN